MKELNRKAQSAEKETKAFFKRIKKNRFQELDDTMALLHTQVFRNTDCLKCANCCRTLGPRLTSTDIERIAKTLRLKSAEVKERYLRIDEDNDYVFKTMPCPFLGEDNYCFIYESRPRACREYPHTDRKNFYQIHALTIKNAATCPAVYEILELLKKRF